MKAAYIGGWGTWEPRGRDGRTSTPSSRWRGPGTCTGPRVCSPPGTRIWRRDLVQETFGRLYVRWGRVSRAENRPTRRPCSPAPSSHTSGGAAAGSGTDVFPGLPGAGDGDASLRLTLLDALARLPAKDRAVVVLRYWDDRSVEQTADLLGVSSAAVRTRCSRALGRLRDLLGEDLSEYARPQASAVRAAACPRLSTARLDSLCGKGGSPCSKPIVPTPSRTVCPQPCATPVTTSRPIARPSSPPGVPVGGGLCCGAGLQSWAEWPGSPWPGWAGRWFSRRTTRPPPRRPWSNCGRSRSVRSGTGRGAGCRSVTRPLPHGPA
ncbi:hypothetical protein SVIOM342S_09504 [Streptomyces violaceorubidus]